MNEVTRILSAIEQGDAQAAEQLLPVVYDELRRLAAHKLAQEKPGQTLQATALVHEAYVRLVASSDDAHWNSRGHFFAAAAEAMRRILLNRARDKKRAKRGGKRQRVDLDQIEIALHTCDEHLIALDEALAELGVEDPDAARLVNVRFFAGLSLKRRRGRPGGCAADRRAPMGLCPRLALCSLASGRLTKHRGILAFLFCSSEKGMGQHHSALTGASGSWAVSRSNAKKLAKIRHYLALWCERLTSGGCQGPARSITYCSPSQPT